MSALIPESVLYLFRHNVAIYISPWQSKASPWVKGENHLITHGATLFAMGWIYYPFGIVCNHCQQ